MKRSEKFKYLASLLTRPQMPLSSLLVSVPVHYFGLPAVLVHGFRHATGARYIYPRLVQSTASESYVVL